MPLHFTQIPAAAKAHKAIEDAMAAINGLNNPDDPDRRHCELVHEDKFTSAIPTATLREAIREVIRDELLARIDNHKQALRNLGVEFD